NVYDLVLRKPLFHGVLAIRLIPIDEGKMFGRDGILAHSYMHGSNGQSNGCVVFREYPMFLDAFLRGDVERLVVVQRLDPAPIAPTGVTTASVTTATLASSSRVRHFRQKIRHVSRPSGRNGYPSRPFGVFVVPVPAKRSSLAPHVAHEKKRSACVFTAAGNSRLKHIAAPKKAHMTPPVS